VTTSRQPGTSVVTSGRAQAAVQCHHRIRRNAHHPHLMSARSQPDGHLARVFADAREFGRKIDAVEADFQRIT
jgi:hypothetical protein